MELWLTIFLCALCKEDKTFSSVVVHDNFLSLKNVHKTYWNILKSIWETTLKFCVTWIWSLMCFTATSPGRTRSPLRTSLRSLQAVRNSRSLEIEDYQPADSQITYPLSGLDLFFFLFFFCYMLHLSKQSELVWQCYITFRLPLRHTNNWTQHSCTFCSIHEFRGLLAHGPDDRREEAAEVSVCQPLQDPSPC